MSETTRVLLAVAAIYTVIAWWNRPTHQSEFFVAKDGRDSATCGAKRTPCRTIGATLARIREEKRIAPPGAVFAVSIGPGEYIESVDVSGLANTSVIGEPGATIFGKITSGEIDE